MQKHQDLVPGLVEIQRRRRPEAAGQLDGPNRGRRIFGIDMEQPGLPDQAPVDVLWSEANRGIALRLDVAVTALAFDADAGGPGPPPRNAFDRPAVDSGREQGRQRLIRSRIPTDRPLVGAAESESSRRQDHGRHLAAAQEFGCSFRTTASIDDANFVDRDLTHSHDIEPAAVAGCRQELPAFLPLEIGARSSGTQ
jgi:hypothetical protein